MSVQSESDSSFRDATHDHAVCVDTALQSAEALCSASGARLTALRRRVLEIVWRGHRPIGAYDVLAELSEDGRRAAPPTVYRALDFLQQHGLVHRVASLNAYVGCAHPGHAGEGQFLICTSCGVAAELRDTAVNRAIEKAARSRGFSPGSHTVEIAGVCPNCVDAEAAAAR